LADSNVVATWLTRDAMLCMQTCDIYPAIQGSASGAHRLMTARTTVYAHLSEKNGRYF